MSDNQVQNVKKENVVFDYVAKFCQNKSLFSAVYLNIHKIDANALTIQNKKTLIDMLMLLVRGGMAKYFVLANGDVLIIFDKKISDDVASILVKIKFVFNQDEKVAMSASLSDCGVAVFYDLATEYGDFSRKVVEGCYSGEKKPIVDSSKESFFHTTPKHYRKELTTEMLAKVQKIISVSDFSSFVRRQAVCAVIGKSKPHRVFEEVFVSIPDMRDSLLPEVEITANPWLFLALTETLDKRVLEIISRHDDGALVGNFSVNINVSTILSDNFLRFDDSINPSMRQSIVLEMQLVDIFSDIRSFILAKTFAKARGYKICIDGITVDKLKFLNRKNLDCDLMKLVWHPSLIGILSEDEHFMDYMNKAERAKIILCRVDDVQAIDAGNALGINLYQGRYVQRLLSASLNK